MVKIQSDNYVVWKGDLIKVTKNAADTLTGIEEVIELDSSSVAFPITLPDTANIETGKVIWFYDDGSANTNNITITNGTGNTIQGGDYVVRVNNQVVKFELIDTVWIVSDGILDNLNIGAFYINENATFTTITTTDTYTDISGTATANSINNNFSLATSPNTLTFTSDDTINALISVTMSISKQLNPFDDIRVAIFKNGFEITGASKGIVINRNTKGLSINFVESITTNDVVKVMVKNLDTTSNILVEDMDLTIYELR